MENQTSPTENLLINNANNTSPSSSSMCTDTQNPVKKPTRQWAAWTRQEEENFFNALRQVGKNFEKITCRVQSKNKDQVCTFLAISSFSKMLTLIITFLVTGNC
ncbi:hypothetical protein B296_00055722 [Ensete ventricosum]|uniref:SANT domain-containing protein n=1 Tax=Ensete ventricosum TaxID=4639 RepID=A0A426XK71_ENSVE|nr:hypothetical protein B296_00055722 [Ensete ventricosum]